MTTASMDEDAEGYRGCSEALVAYPKRRSCFDDACHVRKDCQLWANRAGDGFAIRAMTWRTHWRCFTEPCDYHKPVAAHE